ncbi:MAG: aminoacyl-tRNA hydrolase [Oscillospiraceae bacterium]|nr:aminoacyl-tRNA hydrolase [Oscillospiraceae bacterium]
MFFNANKCDWLIVGLGNPGKQYELSRHNAGFRALDRLCDKNSIRVSRARFGALTGSGSIGGVKVVALKPTTFMNLSGTAVEAAAKYYKITPAHILVLFDDVSLPPGHIRIRADGSAGGHNGIRNIIDQLGTESFPRVKIGVGAKPRPEMDLADWVLSMPASQDRKSIEARLDDVCCAVELIVQGKLELAQSRYNG